MTVISEANALKTHCKRGHEFSEENTYKWLRNGKPTRSCKTCQKDRLRNFCAKKKREYRARWYNSNRTWSRENWLKSRYNLTIEAFDEMMKAQNSRCAICEEEMSKPHVDHNHETGVVRELLCAKCNHGIGLFHEKEKSLLRAAEYLRKHKTI